MTVRVYTDASIKDNRGTWAAIVVRPELRDIELSGVLRGSFGSSTAVELAAIANALHVIRARRIAAGGDDVVIYTDSINAVHRINGVSTYKKRKGRRVDPVILRATELVSLIAAEGGFSARAEWVKGHQRLDSKCEHAPFNRRADQLCTKARVEHEKKERDASDAARRRGNDGSRKANSVGGRHGRQDRLRQPSGKVPCGA